MLKKLLAVSLLIVVAAATYVFGSLAYSKFVDLRYRFQQVERKLDVLSAHVGVPIAKYQATRGEAAFTPPPPLSGGAWEMIGGQGVNGSWRADHFDKTRAFAVHDGKLFTGLVGTHEGDAQVWEYDNGKWTLAGGTGVNGSWREGSAVNVLFSIGPTLYAGVGGEGGAEVWQLNAGRWSRVGGGGAGWPAPRFYAAYSMALYKGSLYVGLASNGRGAPAVFKLDGQSWSEATPKIADPACDVVYELWNHTDGFLYAGTAGPPGCGDVYRFDGTAWEQIGGDGIRGSWQNESMSYVLGFASYQGQLVASLSRLPEVAVDFTSIWAFDGKEWRPVGPKVPKLWSDFHDFNHVLTYKGHLLVGAGGTPPGNASIWDFNSSWQLFAGRGQGGSWSRLGSPNMEYVYRMADFKGALVVGFGDSPGMAQVWRYTPKP